MNCIWIISKNKKFPNRKNKKIFQKNFCKKVGHLQHELKIILFNYFKWEFFSNTITIFKWNEVFFKGFNLKTFILKILPGLKIKNKNPLYLKRNSHFQRTSVIQQNEAHHTTYALLNDYLDDNPNGCNFNETQIYNEILHIQESCSFS